MKKQQPLKRLLFSIIMAMIMIVMTILSAVFFINTRKNTDTNYAQNGTLMTEIAKDIIDTKLNQYENTLNLLSSDADLLNNDALKSKMNLMRDNEKSILNIFFAKEEDGSLLKLGDEKLPEGYNPKDRPWYIDAAAKNGEFKIQSPYADVATGKNVITVSKAVIVDNNLIGVIAMDVELTELSDQLGSTGEIIIAAQDGFVVSDTNKSRIGGQEVTKYSIWNNVLGGSKGDFDLTYNSTKYKGYYNTSDKTGWKIMLKTQISELRSAEYTQIKVTMLIIILIIIITLVLTTRVTKRVGKSVGALSDMLNKAADGNFSEYINMDSRVKEFGVLEESFNKMKDNLGHLIEGVNTSVENVADTVDNSLRMSEEIFEAIEQVGSTMGEISGGTNKAADELEEIVENMQNLSSSINMMNKDTNNVNEVAVQTNNLGSKGVEIARLVMDKSNETKSSTEEVSKVVDEVSKSVEKIEGINATISAITGQTNLLALNAAIEAARAGEAGRGFAVVSEEIRKLAEETASSAGQIDSIIKEINNITKVAVSKVMDTAKAVSQQEEAVAESQMIFSEIVSSVESLSNKVTNIDSSITEINNMKNSVLEKVEGLSAMMEETAAGSQEVTASAHEISTSTEKFVQDFSELKEKSETLKDNISTFEI